MTNLRELVHHPAFQLLALVVVSVCLYFPALNFAFVWDDRALILENWYIRDLAGIPGFFFSEFRVDPLTSTNFYRPVVMVTYALDYFLWGENAFGFHLTNLIFNVLVVMLTFLTAREMLRETAYHELVPWVAALLFAVHPTHVESVAFIAGRTDLLCAIFMLLSFLLYLRATRSAPGIGRRALYAGSLTSFLLALLSKEVAVALLVILPLYELYLRPRTGSAPFQDGTRRRWLVLLPYLVVFCLYFFLRLLSVPPGLTLEHFTETPLDRLYPAYMALLKYIQITFVPLGLKYYYIVRLFRTSNPLFWAAIGAIIPLAAVLVYGWRRAPLLAFCALWYLLTLFPALRIIPFAGTDLADRYLYLPTVGSSLILALGILRLAQKKAVYGMAAAAVIAIFFTAMAVSRLGPWKSELTLFSQMVTEEPRSVIGHNNLGRVYSEMGDTDRAIREYSEAIRLDENNKDRINRAAIYMNAGIGAYQKGLYEDAIKAYRMALAEDPGHIKSHYHLGMVYADLKMFAEAEQEYLAAIKRAPWYSEAHNNLGVLYKEMGRLDDAAREYREAIRYYPKNYEAHYSLAVLSDRMGNREEAVRHYQAFISGAPQKYAVHTEKARTRLLQLKGDDRR